MDFSDRDEEESITEFIQIQDKKEQRSVPLGGRNKLLNPHAMNDNLKGSFSNDINIDTINENILKLQG